MILSWRRVSCTVTENDFLTLRVEILYLCSDMVCKKYGPSTNHYNNNEDKKLPKLNTYLYYEQFLIFKIKKNVSKYLCNVLCIIRRKMS